MPRLSSRISSNTRRRPSWDHLDVIEVRMSDVIPAPGHARHYPAAQIRDLARAIERFGFNVPVLIDEANRLLAGQAGLWQSGGSVRTAFQWFGSPIWPRRRNGPSRWPTTGSASGLVMQRRTAHKTGKMNDCSVCTTWGRTPEDRYQLLDLFRARLTFPRLIARVQALHDLHRPHTILVEDHASGTSLIQALRQQSNLPIKAVRPEGDKLTRLNLLTGLVESGHVILPPGAPWIDEFLMEITRVARARYDDQVDSFTRGLTWLRQATRHQFWAF